MTGSIRQRRLFTLTLLLACLAAGRKPAQAQNPESAVGGNQGITVGGFISANHLEYGNRWLGGAGALVDLNLNWRFAVEGEANWARYHQVAGTHATTWLIGPRYQLSAMGRNDQYRPYVKFLIGDGNFNFPYNAGYGNYLVLAPGAGLDYRINRRFRLRLVDFEYQDWPNFSYGSTANVAISTGVRYNLR